MPSTSVFEQLPQLLGGVLRLHLDSYAALQSAPDATLLGGLILLAAGLSEALGHSAVLFINRVRPRRFVPALLSVALYWSLGIALWLVATWLVVTWGFGQSLSWGELGRTLSFACLPLCALFLAAMPYFGVGLYALLYFYSLLCMVAGLEAISSLNTPQALACVVLGWSAHQLLQRTVGRPMVALGKRLERVVSGTALHSDRGRVADIVRERTTKLRSLVKKEQTDDL